ncbi:MAG: ROK family transcriptional regulator [Clostridiales bacterium]|nr:ROK family transcriptional regulator [Clostridiales bacterium]
MQTSSRLALRYDNIKTIYSLIGRELVNSRVQLAKYTNLSKTTISDMVDELLDNGFLVECGIDVNTAMGRKPSILAVNADHNYIHVVSWYRNKLIGALVNTRMEVIERVERHLSDYDDHVAETVCLLQENALLEPMKGRILGVCIVVPSIVDDKRQQIVSTVLRPENEGNNILRLRELLPRTPLAILNDTACYAYAENLASETQEENSIFVNIGKGVGAVWLHKGQMMRGANGMAMQFGHMSIDRNGPACSCGSKGCIERMIGEGVLQEMVQAYGLEAQVPATREVQFRDVGELASHGNGQALEVIRELAQRLAFGLSNLISLFHPEVVVIGGYGMNLGVPYLNHVRDAVSTIGFSQFTSDVDIRFAKVDESAELQGAAGYYMDHHFEFGKDMRGELFLV